jgi:hypothetical protein
LRFSALANGVQGQFEGKAGQKLNAYKCLFGFEWLRYSPGQALSVNGLLDPYTEPKFKKNPKKKQDRRTNANEYDLDFISGTI